MDNRRNQHGCITQTDSYPHKKMPIGIAERAAKERRNTCKPPSAIRRLPSNTPTHSGNRMVLGQVSESLHPRLYVVFPNSEKKRGPGSTRLSLGPKATRTDVHDL